MKLVSFHSSLLCQFCTMVADSRHREKTFIIDKNFQNQEKSFEIHKNISESKKKKKKKKKKKSKKQLRKREKKN